MSDKANKTQRSQDGAFGRSDVLLIALSIGTAMAAVSPAEIEGLITPTDAYLRFYAIVAVSLGLGVVAVFKGLCPLVLQRPRSARSNAKNALVYILVAVISFGLSPLADRNRLEQVEHTWNWARSLARGPVTQLDQWIVCQKLSGRGAAVIVPGHTWLQGLCASHLVQYDTPEHPICAQLLGTDPSQQTDIKDTDNRAPDFVQSIARVAGPFSSVLSCVNPGP